MKESAGEANMTVITIVLIAIVLGVGTIIVNRMMNNAENKAKCSDAGYAGTNRAGTKCIDVSGQEVDIPGSLSNSVGDQ